MTAPQVPENIRQAIDNAIWPPAPLIDAEGPPEWHDIARFNRAQTKARSTLLTLIATALTAAFRQGENMQREMETRLLARNESLERENAALRADRERLDFMERQHQLGYEGKAVTWWRGLVTSTYLPRDTTVRGLIDEAIEANRT